MAGSCLLAMGSVSLAAAGAANLPTLAIRREGAELRLDYRGTLQTAGSLAGPWLDVPNAVSPVRELPVGSGRFFRSRQPDSVFFSRSVIRFAITGPLQAGFELAYAGSPDGIFPPVRKKPYFDATVSVAGYVLPVSLRVRGNSSLHECPFPKMKFKVSSEQRVGTPFEDAREIDVGTHCAEGGRGNIGRLREESAAYREVLAYEVMELLGFTSPRVRRAQIDYHDTTPPQGHGEVGWTVARSALILEDVEVLAARLGGRVLEDLELATLPRSSFDHELVARLHLFHILRGNWDYGLDPEGRGIWNSDVIALERGGFIPVAGDFDLASWVTEVVRVGFPRDYLPELPGESADLNAV